MFENVIMLAGLGGAVVPLVIHLLGRARYRPVEWGAMMFLDARTPPWRDGARLREYALLAVRMAAVGLLAVALARPIAGTATAFAAPGRDRRAVAIVVDCSGSMAYEAVGRSRMQAARSAALQILSTLKREDRAVLIPAGAPAESAAVQLTGDLQSVAARVAELKPAANAARLDEALETAAQLLSTRDREKRQLYVISDQQSESWSGVDEAFAEAWQTRRPRLELDRFVVVPVGGRESDNLAVESIALLNPPAVRGVMSRVEVTVRNHGTEPRSGVPLTLRVAGEESIATTVNVGPASTTKVTLPVTVASPGAAVLTAEIRGATGPVGDDRLDHVAEVAPSIRVLVVRDGEAMVPDPLSAALAPYRTAGRNGPDLATLEIIEPRELGTSDLYERCDVIVLDDAPAISADQVEPLEKFVYAGGGLLLAPGSSSKLDEYNRLLYLDENGLMPGLLQPAVTPDEPLGIEASTIEFDSPVMGFLPREAVEDSRAVLNAMLSARIRRFLPVTGRTPTAHVLAALASGDAFLVEQPFGRGRVALVTCSLRSEWSTLPLTRLYLPLLQSTVQYLASGRQATLNFRTGDEVVLTIAPAMESSRGVVTRPDGVSEACEVSTPVEGLSEVRYSRTDVPGVYTARVIPRGGTEKERRLTFAVAPGEAESDLSPMPQERWQELERWLSLSRMEAGSGDLAPRRDGVDGKEEYWTILVGGVLSLFVLELALTRYWSGGIS